MIDDLLDELFGATVFSKIDLHVGCHQVRMKSCEEYKTTLELIMSYESLDSCLLGWLMLQKPSSLDIYCVQKVYISILWWHTDIQQDHGGSH